MDDWARRQEKTGGEWFQETREMLEFVKDHPELISQLQRSAAKLPRTSWARQEVDRLVRELAPGFGGKDRSPDQRGDDGNEDYSDSSLCNSEQGQNAETLLEYLRQFPPGRARIYQMRMVGGDFSGDQWLAELKDWLQEAEPHSGPQPLRMGSPGMETFLQSLSDTTSDSELDNSDLFEDEFQDFRAESGCSGEDSTEDTMRRTAGESTELADDEKSAHQPLSGYGSAVGGGSRHEVASADQCLEELERVLTDPAPEWLPSALKRLWKMALELPFDGETSEESATIPLSHAFITEPPGFLPDRHRRISALLDRIGETRVLLDTFDHPPEEMPGDQERLPEGVTRPMLVRWWLMPRRLEAMTLAELRALKPDHEQMQHHIFKRRLEQNDIQALEELFTGIEVELVEEDRDYRYGFNLAPQLLSIALERWPGETVERLEGMVRTLGPGPRLLDLVANVEGFLPAGSEPDSIIFRCALARVRRLSREIAMGI